MPSSIEGLLMNQEFDDHASLRQPLDPSVRESIEASVRSGATTDSLVEQFGLNDVSAYFSNADAVHPGDPMSQGGYNAA